MTGARVLVVGGGGREHALAWKLAASPQVESVLVAPGNAGTTSWSDCKVTNVALNILDFEALSTWCSEQNISLVVVGPEDPLAKGIVDHLSSQGICCFGPKSEAAELESSKQFAKEFMTRHGIPTARFQSFQDAEAARSHINSVDYKALVVKASGLAAGKGVVVAQDRAEACLAVNSMLQDKAFGAAGETIVVEELLQGEEVSVLALTDGETVAVMPPCQDYKRLKEGDRGPNTGGMGAVCPFPWLKKEDLEKIKADVLQKTVDGMRKEGKKYVGVLYAGLMLTEDGPKVLEFNCRFGDPETQVLMPLLKSDLYDVCCACVEGKLAQSMPEFNTESATAAVVLVSGGYPDKYEKGHEITGLMELEKTGLLVFHAGTAVRENQLVTTGGRVLAVVATATELSKATTKAVQGAELVKFHNSAFRSDIGKRLCESPAPKTKASRSPGSPQLPSPVGSQKSSKSSIPSPPNRISYKDAGVDIAAGNSLVEAIKPLAQATRRPGCEAVLGGFGAIFDLKEASYKDPLLVSGTDGVGTKLKIAEACGNFSTIGTDLVAMCVNDILAHGAEPLFFLDYYATGKLRVQEAAVVIQGIAQGCQLAGCALVGGETAEMPGVYHNEDFDLAGFAVGAVERSELLPRVNDIDSGDVCVGIQSSGFHSNGFSLIRRVVEMKELSYDMPSPIKTDKTLGEELLTPTRIYVKSVLPVLRGGKVKAFAHITGGGLPENLARVIPDHLCARLDARKWEMSPLFGWLSEQGHVSHEEMAQTFNCGLGAVLIVEDSHAQDVVTQLQQNGEKASIIGSIKDRSTGGRKVRVEQLDAALIRCWRFVPGVTRKKRVAVLISGSGTNLQALIDYTRNPINSSAAEIILVISNKAGVQGLERAQQAGIQTKVINHKDFSSREAFDDALDNALTAAGIEIVCLAGFMRILTGKLVKKWEGRMLNIHPSLLPAFPGANAHKLVLEAGVRISGCTVHFVAEKVDAGAIVAQEAVPVYPGDSEATLCERIKRVEHHAFPQALELVASERVKLRPDGTIDWL